MTLHRGEIWTLTGRQPRNALVLSAGMYNDQPTIRTVLTVPIRSRSGDDAWCVPIGDNEFAVVDRISYTLKSLFIHHVRTVDVQAQMDVNNALFKIIATN